MAHDVLFQPLQAGTLQAPHRVWMAPLTRSRARMPGHVPHDLNATYYAQRASAGLIVSEATAVTPWAMGYAFIPGIWTDEQQAGWRRVVEAVHEEGGRILLQLWHGGRVGHPDLLPEGEVPVAPSAIRADTKTYISADSGMVPVGEPRALERHEIPAVVEGFRRAAERAKDAGFDGIEIHGANGYLLDQFTRDGTNRRTDDYGGTLDKRLRFPLEVAEAVADVVGEDRVGYRISPRSPFNDMEDGDPLKTFTTLARRLSSMGLAYIHVVEGDDDHRHEDVAQEIREAFDGIYVANAAYDGATGAERIASGKADAIAYGRAFLANPDLPRRLREGKPLNEPDPSTFYGGDAKGYTDYPTLEEVPA